MTMSSLRLTERQQFWLFFAIAFVILAAGIGLRDPWPADEPRFALVAKQMVESGNWLIPHRGSEMYSDKPPLFMAMQAFFYTLTGQWRLAFMLPSLLSGLGMLWLVYDLGRRLWNPRVGLYAAAVLLCTFQFVYQVKRAQIDPAVCFFITLANYGLLRHFLTGPNWRAYWLGCFAAGLGVITKGVGVIALFMLLPYVFARWQRWDHLSPIDGSAWRWLAGPLCFLAAIALWLVPLLVAAYTQDSPEFRAYLTDILFRQTAGRYTQSWHHHQPPWYFVSVVLFAWLPLSLAYPWAVPAWVRALKARDARVLLPLAWVAIVIVFFTIPSGKRDVYILPALPLVALLVGVQLETLVHSPAFRRVALGFTILMAVLFVAVGGYAWSGHWPRANLLVEQRGFEGGGAALWGFIVAVGVVAALAAIVLRVRRSLAGVAVTIAAIWLGWGFWAYPVLDASTSSALVMRKAGTMIGPDAELGLVAWKEQNLLRADRPARDFGFLRPWGEQLALARDWMMENPERRWLFVLDEALGDCIDKDKSQHVGHANRREWLLIRADAFKAGCDPRSGATAAADPDDAGD